jgi:uncharacterized protein YqfA (UPF0365 family)
MLLGVTVLLDVETVEVAVAVLLDVGIAVVVLLGVIVVVGVLLAVGVSVSVALGVGVSVSVVLEVGVKVTVGEPEDVVLPVIEDVAEGVSLGDEFADGL